jgi:glycerate kinase
VYLVKIVLAPDSYKGSLTAKQACDAMEAGIRKIAPAAQIVKIPMADGGEGTVQSLIDATGGLIFEHEVSNPLGELVKAKFGIMGDGTTAVIEMAEASGLNLISKERRNPLITSTYGTGQLIRKAMDMGCHSFILGIGGSGTNDGGAGMAQALGAKLLDQQGKEIASGGGSLGNLRRIDLSDMDSRLRQCTFRVACDVNNPLCGPSGASYVYGEQKGATPEMMKQLDQNLVHFSGIIARDIGVLVEQIPGAGAAGGLGAGLVAFLQAKLEKGVNMVIKATGLVEQLYAADLVITGEGRCDDQTVRGKTPYGVAKAAQRLSIPVIVIAGSIGPGIEVMYQHGVHSVFSMMDRPMTVDQAMSQAAELLTNATERILRLILISKM